MSFYPALPTILIVTEGYSETGDYWKKLLPMQQRAIERSRRFVIPDRIDLKRCANGTNIYELFDDLRHRKGNPDSEWIMLLSSVYGLIYDA